MGCGKVYPPPQVWFQLSVGCTLSSEEDWGPSRRGLGEKDTRIGVSRVDLGKSSLEARHQGKSPREAREKALQGLKPKVRDCWSGRWAGNSCYLLEFLRKVERVYEWLALEGTSCYWSNNGDVEMEGGGGSLHAQWRHTVEHEGGNEQRRKEFTKGIRESHGKPRTGGWEKVTPPLEQQWGPQALRPKDWAIQTGSGLEPGRTAFEGRQG